MLLGAIQSVASLSRRTEQGRALHTCVSGMIQQNYPLAMYLRGHNHIHLKVSIYTFILQGNIKLRTDRSGMRCYRSLSYCLSIFLGGWQETVSSHCPELESFCLASHRIQLQIIELFSCLQAHCLSSRLPHHSCCGHPEPFVLVLSCGRRDLRSGRFDFLVYAVDVRSTLSEFNRSSFHHWLNQRVLPLLDNLKKMKSSTTDWEKMFAINLSDKVPISRIYKELLQIYNNL